MLICLLSVSAFAEDNSIRGDNAYYYSILAISCVCGMAIASGVCALAQSRAIAAAMSAIGRQPSVAKDIQAILIIGLALIEALGLYTLVVALIFIFTVNPF
ncbi:ATP synthase F0 subunit C [bacterium]|nr:ATP synthase F0 subunit C [bacterium]